MFSKLLPLPIQLPTIQDVHLLVICRIEKSKSGEIMKHFDVHSRESAPDIIRKHFTLLCRKQGKYPPEVKELLAVLRYQELYNRLMALGLDESYDEAVHKRLQDAPESFIEIMDVRQIDYPQTIAISPLLPLKKTRVSASGGV